MKKAYVKVKPKSVKKTLVRPYIIVTVISAALCAFALSYITKPDEVPDNTTQIDISQVTPEEIAQVSEPVEIVVEKEPEITKTETKEIPQSEEKAEEVAARVSEPEFALPVKGEVINEFSGSKPVKSKTMGDWRVHSGIDIKAKSGIEVKCPADGKVTVAKDDSLTGKTVTVDHGEGYVTTVYNLGTISVKKGQQVKAGEVLGTVGISAPVEAAEDAHVHFEMKKAGKYVNPLEYTE